MIQLKWSAKNSNSENLNFKLLLISVGNDVSAVEKTNQAFYWRLQNSKILKDVQLIPECAMHEYKDKELNSYYTHYWYVRWHKESEITWPAERNKNNAILTGTKEQKCTK